MLPNLHAQDSGEGYHWEFSGKKISDSVFELHLHIVVGGGYHTFSQDTKGEIGKPTYINFNKNPLVVFVGKIKEVSPENKSGNDTPPIYHEEVDFVQRVKLKSRVKTNISGTVEFQVCNDDHCEFPDPLPFSIALQ